MIVHRWLLALALGGSALLSGVPAAGAGSAESPGSTAGELPDPQAQEVDLERRIRERTERARREAEFNQLDVDGDGYLTPAELAAREGAAPAANALDQDDDGRISRTEFAALEAAPADGNR